MQSINEIKEILKNTDVTALSEFIKHYNTDERSGVKKLVLKAEKEIEAYNKEVARTENLKFFENKYSDYNYICGIDEVGRGPLAGPVVAGAVILPKDCDILYINDSKKLTASKREELFQIIMEKAVSAKTALVSPQYIDKVNILQATYEAMREAVSQLTLPLGHVLADAVRIPKLTVTQTPIIKGDAKCYSIAAASIIAKVTRDRIMREYDRIYPGYGFSDNKGYGSAAHIETLKKKGPVPIHRRTFISAFWQGEQD